MSLIEKGADPKLFESVKKTSTGGILKWGLLLIGIGLGIFFAAILVNAGFDEGAAYPAMICFVWRRRPFTLSQNGAKVC